MIVVVCGFKGAYQRIKGHVPRRRASEHERSSPQGGDTTSFGFIHMLFIGTQRCTGKYVFVGEGLSFGPATLAVWAGCSLTPNQSFESTANGTGV